MDDSAGSNDDLLYDTDGEETMHPKTRTDDENTFNWLGNPTPRTDDEESMSEEAPVVRPAPRWYINQHTQDWLDGKIQTGDISTGSGPWDPASLSTT